MSCEYNIHHKYGIRGQNIDSRKSFAILPKIEEAGRVFLCDSMDKGLSLPARKIGASASHISLGTKL